MKKRLLAGFLPLVMVLSLLPASAFASTGTAGVANVYTLADIKAATNDSSVTTIRLMNDIDANKESISYYRSSDYTTVADSLRQGVTLDGQGHTIYNLKTTLLRVNAGTIKNLNTTVHDTPEDSERLVYHMTAQYSGAQVNISGIAVQNHGTIESCNTLFTLEGERSQVTFRLSGITAYNDGTIRDCIASYDVDYHIKNGGAWLTGAASFAGLAYSNSGLIDHSLVLGSVIVSGDAYCSDAIGLTNMSQCTDSACALERLSLTCNDEIDFSPAFQTYTGSTAGAKNCRVAADLQVTNISEKKNIHESGTVSGGKGYTLASRADILKDWDTSNIPSETPPTNITTDTDTDVIPDDYVPIYTLADLKTKTHDGYYLLMNDIDASQEDVKYDGNGYNANSVCGRLFSGGVLNGNGHTIYNLRGPLFECNMGTIRNLNITLTNRGKDTDTFDVGKSLAGIALSNYNGGMDGLIEDCTVTMTVHRTFGKLAGSLSINGISSGGTIRNCIAKLGIYLDASSTSDSSHMIYVSGIGSGTNNSLVDHCLVLGNIGVVGCGLGSGKQPVSFAGISACTAQDSACALESLTVTAKSSREKPYEYFTLSSGGTTLAGTDSIRNRVASGLEVSYNFNGKTILSGKPTSQAGTYTLDTRANILKDWDLSVLPDPDTLLKTDFTRGTAEFHFMGNSGKTRTWHFNYDDNYFYGQEDDFGYDADLAKASACLEMASFSAHVNSNFNKDLDEDNLIRAENIQELYHTLGFDPETYQFFNYDTALTSTNDKVAYSMAMKYIQNPDGSTDTLIAVPIRGGGYGNEWASNFHVADDFSSPNLPTKNHVGFQKAANGVLSWLKFYVNRHKDLIKGDLKLWIVGYSRAAATANLLGHSLNELTVENSRSSSGGLGGCTLHLSDIYVYTFATPAGATYGSAASAYDPNIYNIVSPVDLVPRVAPGAWGFTRYGTTLTLPAENYKEVWQRFQSISGLETDGINESQRTIISRFSDEAFGSREDMIVSNHFIAFKVVPYSQLQDEVMALPTKDPSFSLSSFTKKLSSIIKLIGLAGATSFGPTVDVLIRAESVGTAHFLEHYLARLETDDLQNESDFDRVSHARSVLLYNPYNPQNAKPNVNVEFWKSSSSRAAGSSVGSYRNGVCTSGEVSVEMTDIGLIATFPAGADYTFTVSGADAGKLAMTVYAYDGETLDPARTMDWDSLPAKDGTTCTVYVPEEPYDDFYVKDAGGKDYYPDSDSEHSLPFTDVPVDAYFRDAVEWAVGEGITGGTSATTFSPYNVCTRAQAVTFLWRADGSPKPESSRSPFTDVKAGSYYYDAVLWAVEQGITSGTTPTTFSPDATCTRGQIVTFLYHSWGDPEVETRASFRDVPAGAYYADPVNWAADWGVTGGTSATTFSPNAFCTRAQIVTFLYRSYFG